LLFSGRDVVPFHAVSSVHLMIALYAIGHRLAVTGDRAIEDAHHAASRSQGVDLGHQPRAVVS
jgi:hypothetical protein